MHWEMIENIYEMDEGFWSPWQLGNLNRTGIYSK